MSDNLKTAICDALAAFINQPPGMDIRNYDADGYREDSQRCARDRRDATTLLVAVRHADDIAAQDIINASERAYSGRLTIRADWHQYRAEECPGRPCSTLCDHRGAPYRVRVDYCVGQYFPTEYRSAAAHVLAACLFEHKRKTRPELPDGHALRREFRRDFGSELHKRYFD